MAVVALDTHATVKELLAVGFTDEQDEALTAQLRRVQDVDLSNLATKSDLAALATKAELAMVSAELASLAISTKADIASLAMSTRADLAETKADIQKWMAGAIGIQTVVIIGAMLALVRMIPC